MRPARAGAHRTPKRLAHTLPIMALALLGIVAITFSATSCSDSSQGYAEEDQENYEEIVTPPYYDEAGFGYFENDRMSYSGKHGATDIVGVDVSEIQDEIDWAAVKEDGISFAMIRIGSRGTTEGLISEDENFESNYEGATEAGIKCGAYFFSQAITEAEAVEEANFVLEKLDGRSLDYPVALDLEASEGTRTFGKESLVMSEVARAFCETIRKAGYDVVIYGNYFDLDYLLKDEKLSDYDTWYAQYDIAPDVTYKCRMWQYSNSGSVSGIATNVDLNLDLAPLS